MGQAYSYTVTYKYGGVQEDFIFAKFSIRSEKVFEGCGFSEDLTRSHVFKL